MKQHPTGFLLLSTMESSLSSKATLGLVLDVIQRGIIAINQFICQFMNQYFVVSHILPVLGSITSSSLILSFD